MPSDRPLERRLAGLYAPASPPERTAAHRDRLEHELLARLAAVAPGARPASVPRRRRFVLGGLVLAGAIAGACVLPTEYDIGLGQHVALVLSGEAAAALDPRELGRYLERRFGPERLEIRVQASREVGGNGEDVSELRVDLVAFGTHATADEIWGDLARRFPELSPGRVEGEALSATVEGTLAGRLGHAWLDVTIDARGVEAARQQILDDLAARGMQGEASVEIHEADGHREVEVRVRATSPERAPEGPA